MVLPGFVKDHPLISTVSVLLILATLGFTAFNFPQGTFVSPPSDCSWETVENPDTGQQYSDLSNYLQGFRSINDIDESQKESYTKSIDSRFRDVDSDGEQELQIKTKGCISGSFSGEAQSN